MSNTTFARFRFGEASGQFGRLGGEVFLGKRGEGPQWAEDRIARGVRRIEPSLPEVDRGPEPLGNQLFSGGTLVQFRVPGIELQVVGRLEIERESLAQVLLDLDPAGRQEVVALLSGLVELGLVRLRLGIGLSAGRVEPGKLVGLDRAGEDAVKRVVVFAGDRDRTCGRGIGHSRWSVRASPGRSGRSDRR